LRLASKVAAAARAAAMSWPGSGDAGVRLAMAGDDDFLAVLAAVQRFAQMSLRFARCDLASGHADRFGRCPSTNRPDARLRQALVEPCFRHYI
jgi:hypothetical protein